MLRLNEIIILYKKVFIVNADNIGDLSNGLCKRKFCKGGYGTVGVYFFNCK